jgi:Tfp pilus assembly protein PilE
MEAVAVRNKLHQLIDSVENAELLERFYVSFNAVIEQKEGVWQTLSESDKKHVLEAYESSFDATNLIEHDTIKAKYAKWLTK